MRNTIAVPAVPLSCAAVVPVAGGELWTASGFVGRGWHCAVVVQDLPELILAV